MSNHEKRGNPGLTYPEAHALLGVLGDIDPAHFEDRSAAYEAACKSGEDKLRALARGSVMVPFTQAEIGLLWEALENGAEGVLQSFSGRSSAQKRAFCDAANRLRDAGKITLPRMST